MVFLARRVHEHQKTVAGGGLAFLVSFLAAFCLVLIGSIPSYAVGGSGTCKGELPFDESEAISICQSRYPDYPYCTYYEESPHYTVVCTNEDYSPDPEPIKLTATIKYEVNGGSGTVKDQSKTSTASGAHDFKLRPNPATPPTGETFLGWAMNGSATKPIFQPGDQLTVQYGATITLYAVYGAQGSTTNDCVVQMPTTGAPEGLSQLGVIAVGFGLLGVSIGLMRRCS